MNPNFHLPSLVLSLTLITPAVGATEAVVLQKESFTNLQQQFHLVLPNSKQVSNFPSLNSLEFIRQHTDHNQITHIRMQQKYAGFLVYGGYAIIHSSSKASTLLTSQASVKMNGTVYRGLQDELGDAANDFVKNGAMALAQFKSQFQGKDISEEQVKPIVYIDGKQKAHWAYRVSLYIRHDDKIPERPTAILDAKSYKPFIQWNDIKTIAQSTPVKGMGYGGNNKTGEYVFGKTHPLLDLTRDNAAEMCYMENKAVKVIDMQHTYRSSNKAMKFKCVVNSDAADPFLFWTGYKADGYDRENGAFSPSNDALYAGQIIKRMYQDWYGVDVLSQNGKPMKLVMRVHYGEGYDNAYWDGEQMTFGDGNSVLYPLVSLDIGAHEISHGFTEQHSNLEYRKHSGGINEAFSDMAAKAAEFYATGANNWEIAAEIMKESSGRGALRYMDKPSRDGLSIDSADKYSPRLNVHFSSGVYNRLFYLIANTPGWNTRKAFDIMVKANMDYWTPNTTFDEAGCGVINAAYDLGFSIDDVKKALTKVAVNYKNCAI